MAEGDTDEQTAQEAEPPESTFPGWVIWATGLLALALLAFGVLVVTTGHDLRSYANHGGGMLPTIRLGEQITADKGNTSPQRGDIVVFHPPRNAISPLTCGAEAIRLGPNASMCATVGTPDSSQAFVKRVVGLPGDHLALAGGYVIRNGQREAGVSIRPCASGDAYCNLPTPIVVPAGTYYVLGDNRGASDDSRFWGPVKRSWIIGVLVHCSLLDSFCSKVR